MPKSRFDKTAVFFIRRSTSITLFLLLDYYWTSLLVAGARTWNDLPVDVTSVPSLLTFRK